MIQLNSSRLRVEIAEPGEAPNTTFRFDRAGFITEVVLDGARRFCASEPRNLSHPSSGGRGLCSEYIFDVSEEAELGEYFPKLGVGLLRRFHEGGYRLFDRYESEQPFPVTIQVSEAEVAFSTSPVVCMGYALRTERRVSVEENRLIMHISAENVGEKPVRIHEYCHNFLSIDGMAIGSDYLLEMPSIPDLGQDRLRCANGANGSLRGCGRGFTFCEMSAVPSDHRVDGADMLQDRPFMWKLSHRGAGAFVQGEADFIPSGMNLWAVDHIVSPEVFYTRLLQPGERCTWERKWTFDAL